MQVTIFARTRSHGETLPMNDEQFDEARKLSIARLQKSASFKELCLRFVRDSGAHNYSYNFDWLGLPIIQYPQDIIAIQEIIWRVRPRLIIEVGIARGGLLALSASILELAGGDGRVVGVDIDIRSQNRSNIEAHPLSHRIDLIEGSSTDPRIHQQVAQLAAHREPVMVFLDSMHTHQHVLDELHAYSPLVSIGSYIVVFDTSIDDMPAGYFKNRPWGPGNNPRTAMHQFLGETDSFVIDHGIGGKLGISVAVDGYLQRIS